ncbi:MAG: M12 family metallo-peptidase, partial [Salinibacter sp.]
LAEGLEAGQATVPIATPDTEIVEMTLASAPANLRPDSVDTGLLRQGPETAEQVPLPPEASFFVGACRESGATPCGGLTILDQDQTMVRGLVRHSDYGLSYIQSVNQTLGTDQYPGLHIIYNAEHAAPPTFSEAESPKPNYSESNVGGSGLGKSSGRVEGKTSVVLDGDAQFYNSDPSTVWRRQESLMFAVQLTTYLIEPATSGTWSLKLSIAGQEAWTTGGPSSDNGENVIDRLEDPGYYLINSLSEDQLHLFLLGYNVASPENGGLDYGLLGLAGGIGHKKKGGWGRWSRAPTDVTDNHLLSEARAAQGWHTKAATLTHEVGHLIGGLHGKAIGSGCSGSACGRSIMNGTLTSSQEFFFSDNNDQRINTVISNTLP